MVKIRSLFFIFLFLIAPFSIYTNEFIAKKKPAKQSANSMREEICQSVLCGSQEINPVHIQLTLLDGDLKDLMREIVNNDFLSSCDKKQLDAGKQQMTTLRKELHDIHIKIQDIRQQCQALRTTLFPQ